MIRVEKTSPNSLSSTFPFLSKIQVNFIESYFQKIIELNKYQFNLNQKKMGACQCPSNQSTDLAEINMKMVQSKYSMQSQFMPQPPKFSKMLSSSTIYSNIFKITSQADDRISSRVVRSRQKDLPLSHAAQYRDLMVPEEETYIQNLSAKYVGEVYNGRPSGFGKLYFDNDDYLQGIFVEGRCEGKGRYIKQDGSYYEGDIKNNVADGHGIYIDKKGYKYQGQWKNNMPNGSGEAIFPDESRYVGEFLNNKKHGRGTLFEGQNIYRGMFKNDLFDGKLEYISSNGEQYRGEWKQNKKHGYGVYKWPDGGKYQGYYKDGHRSGNGLMTYANGDQYTGEWLEGVKHGKGKFISETQNIIGVWKKGKLVELAK